MVDLLLDSTFILPTLGIEVQEIEERDIRMLRSSGKHEIHCCYVSMVEVLGKVARELERKKKRTEIVSEGLRSLFESGVYKWINPDAKAYRLALDMRMKGHKDMIDNLLYSTALSLNLRFLSLDDELKTFLARKGYDTNVTISIRALERTS